jgi:phage shock protein A
MKYKGKIMEEQIFERASDDLTGMSVLDAKEYIRQHIITLKLTEKARDALAEQNDAWVSRISLAQSTGVADLAGQAQQELDNIRTKYASLGEEIADLKAKIEKMKQQLPGLAARERSIDPDLLQQELLIATGYLPGDDDKAAADQEFRVVEKSAAADAALEALKEKMKQK